MDDFDKNKEYDLDYFNDKKNSDDASKKDLMPGDNISDDDSFDLNAFKKPKDVDDDSLNLDDFGEKDEEVDLTSFGKKQGEIKKEDRKKSHDAKKQKVKKGIFLGLKIFASIMLIGIITGCLVVGAFAIYVFNFVDDTVHEDLDELALGFTTTIYVEDETSGEYVEYQRLHGEENRIWVDFENMPENLKNAFVAVEDQRFRDHQGVDWKRTVGAFVNMFIDLYSSNQGGSTITQQLVKNLTNDNKQTPMRKIREIMRARYLEENYEKDTILECYLNTICLGGGIYGVEVASNYYFGKSTNELTLVECASLACIVKEPERYRPDRHPEKNKERRGTVLRLMKEQKYISEDVYKEAIATDIEIVADESAKNSDTVNSYFIDAVIEEVIDRLVEEYGMDKSYASKNFYNGGYKIYCTLKPEIQTVLEEEYAKMDKYFYVTNKKTGKHVQSAMTVMDYEGHIVGIVGGAGDKTENRGLNRATMSYRQPGSTIKPVATYSQAIQKNLIHYSSLVVDEPLDKYYPNGGAGPRNAHGYYEGPIIAAYALERSVNTIPCHLIKKMGVESTYYYLANNFGIDNLDGANDMNLSSLGLGGMTHGITTTQSAAAFAVFGNLGTYYKPTTITLMTDQRDKVILKQESGIAAIDENTATIVNHMLQGVVYGENGTGRGAASFSDTIKCYGKTGTATGANDCWFAGGTPYYVGSCWYGYDDPATVSPGSLARVMWTAVMKRIHKNLEPKEFVDSEFTTNRYYCKSTGLLATDKCTEIGEGWYKTNYSLPAVCTEHPGEVRPVVGAEPVVPEGGTAGDGSTSGANGTSSTASTSSTGDSTDQTSQPTTSSAGSTTVSSSTTVTE